MPICLEQNQVNGLSANDAITNTPCQERVPPRRISVQWLLALGLLGKALSYLTINKYVCVCVCVCVCVWRERDTWLPRDLCVCVCLYIEREICLPRDLWFEVYSFSLVVVCSLVAACRLHFWILIPRTGIKPRSPALEGGFLTTGPPGNSLQYLTFKHRFLHNYDSVSDSHSVVSDSLRPHELYS